MIRLIHYVLMPQEMFTPQERSQMPWVVMLRNTPLINTENPSSSTTVQNIPNTQIIIMYL